MSSILKNLILVSAFVCHHATYSMDSTPFRKQQVEEQLPQATTVHDYLTSYQINIEENLAKLGQLQDGEDSEYEDDPFSIPPSAYRIKEFIKDTIKLNKKSSFYQEGERKIINRYIDKINIKSGCYTLARWINRLDSLQEITRNKNIDSCIQKNYDCPIFNSDNPEKTRLDSHKTYLESLKLDYTKRSKDTSRESREQTISFGIFLNEKIAIFNTLLSNFQDLRIKNRLEPDKNNSLEALVLPPSISEEEEKNYIYK